MKHLLIILALGLGLYIAWCLLPRRWRQTWVARLAQGIWPVLILLLLLLGLLTAAYFSTSIKLL